MEGLSALRLPACRVELHFDQPVGRAVGAPDRALVACSFFLFDFFFFQAEDGIRDLYVTGVQTCALPICFPALWLRWWISWVRAEPAKNSSPGRSTSAATGRGSRSSRSTAPRCPGSCTRSEERRVGKECRCRRGTDQERKKRTRREGKEP